MPKRGQMSASASKRSKQQRAFNSRPEQKKNRAARNKARRAAERSGKVSKGDGKDVGHKRSLKGGGSKGVNNTRVESRSSNRSHGGRIGNRKAKGRRRK